MRPRHTGSLRLRGRTWWARYLHNGVRVEVSTGETDRGRAATFLKNKLKDAGTPRFILPTVQKFRFDDLCDLLRRDHTRKRNRSKIEYKLAHLAETFANMPALAITALEIDRYYDHRIAEGAQPATVNRELSALRRAFRLAVRAGLLPTMPAFTLRSEDNVREGFLDPADLDAFLAALRLEDPDVADVTECAYWTLLRRGNALGALWTWLSLEVERGHVVGGRLRIPSAKTKNKQPLALPLSGRLLALIDRRWQRRIDTSPYVFHREGQPIVRFDRVWEAAARAIGRPDLLFHDLRRSAARALRRAGVDEETIMKLGGWKTRSMFTRYAIVDEQDLAEALGKLDAALAAPGPSKVTPLRRRKANAPPR